MKTKSILLLLLLGICSINTQNVIAQNRAKSTFFSFGVGAGILALETNEKTRFSVAPSLAYKGGYMISEKTAVILLIQGAAYKNWDNDKTRGVGGLTLGAQHWIYNKWWALGGLGVGLETPPMLAKNETWNLGFPALNLSTGYEIWRNGKYSVDIQSVFLLGRSKIYKSSGTGNIYFSGVSIAVNM